MLDNCFVPLKIDPRVDDALKRAERRRDMPRARVARHPDNLQRSDLKSRWGVPCLLIHAVVTQGQTTHYTRQSHAAAAGRALKLSRTPLAI